MTKKRLKGIIGDNIRNQRISRNISIDELSELLGLTPGFVGLIERGQRGATPSTLYKLSGIFGMTIDDFFNENDGSLLTLGEKRLLKSADKRRRIETLTSDFTGREIDFLIRIIKSVRVLIRNPLYDMEAGEELMFDF